MTQVSVTFYTMEYKRHAAHAPTKMHNVMVSHKADCCVSTAWARGRTLPEPRSPLCPTPTPNKHHRFLPNRATTRILLELACFSSCFHINIHSQTLYFGFLPFLEFCITEVIACVFICGSNSFCSMSCLCSWSMLLSVAGVHLPVRLPRGPLSE